MGLTFGAKLKLMRIKNNLTQKELAEKLRITRSSIDNYECGYNMPRINHVIKLAELFNVPTDYFLKDE